MWLERVGRSRKAEGSTRQRRGHQGWNGHALRRGKRLELHALVRVDAAAGGASLVEILLDVVPAETAYLVARPVRSRDDHQADAVRTW